MREIQQEITPLNKDDLFIILNYPNAKFDYPIHCHPEYELNLVMKTKGNRVVGEEKSNFEGVDLVLIGPYLPHVWKTDTDTNHTITIQFSGKFLEYPIVATNLFASIKLLLEDSKCGLVFTEPQLAVQKIIALTKMTGFESALAFFDLLNTLSVSHHSRLTDSFNPEMIVRQSKSRRVTKVCKYIEENLNQDIKMSEMAALVNMSESAFSHFFKKRTQISFKTYLGNLRISKACNLLATTTASVSEICYDCGFNNKSNFFRIFAKKKNMTPLEYRNYISELIIEY